MSTKSILFNTDMVRAILDGRKSCTRRLVKFLSGENPKWTGYIKDGSMLYNGRNEPCIRTQPYQPGDILYIRETWCKGLERYIYRADYSDTEKFYRDGKEIDMKWHSSLHMPKEAARIFLRVTNVRVERLQDITEDGCIAEGIYPSNCRGCNATFGCDICPDEGYDEFDKFMEIWDSTIKKSDIDHYGWQANPWVWVIEFERCEHDMSNRADKECFISNGEPYPLCKGKGEQCHECCLYENYEEYNSPY